MGSTSQHVILFYRYHPLTEDRAQIEIYRAALETLCHRLGLYGRILVGASKTEGINGTLAGKSQDCVRAFTWALLKDVESVHGLAPGLSVIRQAIVEFWSQSASFFSAIGEEELRMESPHDFKWSVTHDDDPLFPDLRIVVRKELIGTGNTDLSHISLAETAQGYLSPEQWNKRLGAADTDSTVVIDCRNTKEFAIGHFEGALDPQTTTYAQFPQWVQNNRTLLANKQVLMYCTGGVRCEKASAYIRKTVPEVGQVNHLKGGIHKYLELFGDSANSLWRGKNFVFDSRQAVSAEETQLGKDGVATCQVSESTEASHSHDIIVGSCIYCGSPHDQFEAKCVCTVCREPILACLNCQKLPEFHCRQHFHLRDCYFVGLERFTEHDLREQHQMLSAFLSEIAVGRKFKQKRKTLLKQCQRIDSRLAELSKSGASISKNSQILCRNCGQASCSGKCWGFFGLKRKEALESFRKNGKPDSISDHSEPLHLLQKVKRPRQRKGQDPPEIFVSGLFLPASSHRDPKTGIRVPPCITRTLSCRTKGKWCGQSVAKVVQEEFSELAKLDRLKTTLQHGLLHLNGKALDEVSIAKTRFKSSDVLSRVLHWHEAPVVVPETIGVEKIALPLPVVEAFSLKGKDASIFLCNKPASVPVHPAGPYFANTLMFMVEAQLGLSPRSLNPVHRTDRVTSGLTLCCSDPGIARIFHIALSEGWVRKTYLAKVRGRFPSKRAEFVCPKPGVTWSDDLDLVEVDAPVWTSDPGNGIRAISTSKGKSSQSRFKLVNYDAPTDTSVIMCSPLTGRNHQLRLHLSWMGFPIMHDVQYGGEAALTGDADMSQASIACMQEAMRSADSGAQSDMNATKACPVCIDEGGGIEACFSSAQLLKQGHAIMLHAWKYEVTFTARGKEVASAIYSVGLPDWLDPALKPGLSDRSMFAL